MTGYEIKQAYEKGPANFMPISFGQIYPVTGKLRRGKMVLQNKQPGGRKSISYSITARGEKAFRTWLFFSGDLANYRELLLRLFFATSENWELAAMSKHFADRNRPISTTMRQHEGGWTRPKLAIHGSRSGSWCWNMASCRASPACSGLNERWRL